MEQAHFYHRPDVYGLDVLHASFVRHRYPRHVHDFYVFGIIERGFQTFSYRRDKHATTQGGIIVLNPDEPHTGEPAAPTGFTWKAIYPSADLLRSVASQIMDRNAPLPFFTQPVTYDPDLAARLLRLHQSLVTPTAGLSSETYFLDFVSALITRYADARFVAPRPAQATAALRRVRDYIETHYADAISLDQLAQIAALSPYHLTRMFNRQFGLPPHAYLESVRIHHARQMLVLGQPIVEVALATGFADQSHFTQRFRRSVGVPPGEFLKERKIATDSAL